MSAKYQVVKFIGGVPRPIRECGDKERAYKFADRFNRFLLDRDGPLCRAFLVMREQTLVRGPADVMTDNLA